MQALSCIKRRKPFFGIALTERRAQEIMQFLQVQVFGCFLDQNGPLFQPALAELMEELGDDTNEGDIEQDSSNGTKDMGKTDKMKGMKDNSKTEKDMKDKPSDMKTKAKVSGKGKGKGKKAKTKDASTDKTKDDDDMSKEELLKKIAKLTGTDHDDVGEDGQEEGDDGMDEPDEE